MPLKPVPLYKDGVTAVNEGGLNPPLQALLENQQDLENRLQGLQGSSRRIFTDTGFSPECVKGMLVAFDPTSGMYVPAAAAWNGEFAADGSMEAADSAYVFGVLVSDVESSGRGVVMTSGWVSDPALVGLLSAGGPAGRYYLSNNGSAVHVSAYKQTLPVYCFFKNTNGNILFDPKVPESRGHSHNNAYLPFTNWVAAAGSGVNGLPPEATFVYDDTNDDAAKRLRLSYQSGLSLIVDGKMAPESAWGRTAEGYIYYNWTMDDTNKLYVHSILPLLGTDPAVRAIGVVKGEKVLKLTKTSGTVLLETDFEPAETAKSGYAIAEVGENGIVRTPVISGIVAGPGVVLEQSVDGAGKAIPGSITVSSAVVLKTLLDLQVWNYDSAITAGAPFDLSTVFPAGIRSTVTGGIRIPYHGKAGQRARLVLWVQGTGGTINALEAKVAIHPAPEDGNPTWETVPATVAVTPTAAPDQNKVYKLQTADIGEVPGNALVTVMLASLSPATKIVVKSIALELI